LDIGNLPLLRLTKRAPKARRLDRLQQVVDRVRAVTLLRHQVYRETLDVVDR
jgi:hypothetical protein